MSGQRGGADPLRPGGDLRGRRLHRRVSGHFGGVCPAGRPLPGDTAKERRSRRGPEPGDGAGHGGVPHFSGLGRLV